MSPRCIKPSLLGAPIIREVLAISIHPRGDTLTKANIHTYLNMNLKEFNNYLQSLPEEILPDAAEIIAETATEHFKQAFKVKAFDGNPWPAASKPRSNGSLWIDSGALVNSIRPSEVSAQRVVISAGNDKVDYAAVHNEGFNGTVAVPEHTRKGAPVKAHTKTVSMPRRQFMGDSETLVDLIHQRIEGYIDSLTQQ